MEVLEIEVSAREETGKRPSKQLRLEGRVPAIFYGAGQETISVSVAAKQFQTKVSAARGMHLLRLKSPHVRLADKVVLLKEVQIHPLSKAVLHADFYQVDLTKKISVRVPLEFTGKAEGVVLGGILQPIEREIEVNCLPMDIPESIPVDVTPMKIGDSLHYSHIPMPSGVEAIYDVDSAVAIIAAPSVEEVAAPAPEEAAAAQAAPEAKKEAESKEAPSKSS